MYVEVRDFTYTKCETDAFIPQFQASFGHECARFTFVRVMVNIR